MSENSYMNLLDNSDTLALHQSICCCCIIDLNSCTIPRLFFDRVATSRLTYHETILILGRKFTLSLPAAHSITMYLFPTVAIFPADSLTILPFLSYVVSLVSTPEVGTTQSTAVIGIRL